MTRNYNCKSATRRWPMQIWYNILNLACINSWIIYKEINNSKISRRDFIIKLIEEINVISNDFGEPKTKKRKATAPRTPTSTKSHKSQQSSTPQSSRKRCQIRNCNGNMAKATCNSCNKFTCGICTFETIIICEKCKN
jgi:hypothetical protein